MNNQNSSRIKRLNTKPPVDGKYVLYWMQQSQRVKENHALEYAIHRANDLKLPVIVGFGLTDRYPDANLRHYTFMIQGLQDVKKRLQKRSILFVVQKGQPDEVALKLGRKASLIVCDRGYLRHLKEWRNNVASDAKSEVVQIESDLIVPVESVSGKAEYAARTFRPKILRQIDEYLDPVPETHPKYGSLRIPVKSLDLDSIDKLLSEYSIDTEVKRIEQFVGGTTTAELLLTKFITNHLKTYKRNRNQPHTDNVSHMSKYLHFGHISPCYIVRQIRASSGSNEDRDAFLDELIVRRELTYNFTNYATDYDRYDSVPTWAHQTLHKHRSDNRPYVYSVTQLDKAATHDPYWNAAMKEMKYTGYMHNYMRMYWGKKILEWSNGPENAFKTALKLNNKYFIDGRDPNSYANIGWIFGLHDHPWQEREVYGKVRIMTSSGLKRKTNPEAYVAKVDRMIS